MTNLHIKVYVFYHDEVSKVVALDMCKKYTYMTPIKLSESKMYETQFFLRADVDDFVDDQFEFIGFVTYNYLNKVKSDEDILKACHGHHDKDVVALYDFRCDLLSQAQRVHGDVFKQSWNAILERLGYTKQEVEDRSVPAFFCNFWLARPIWLKRYIRFVRNACDIIDKDAQICRLLNSDARYRGSLPTDHLMRLTGKPHYTLHPFIFERLPCFFFYHSGAIIGRRTSGDSVGKYVKDVADDLSKLLADVKDIAVFAAHCPNAVRFPMNTTTYIQQLSGEFERVLVVCTSIQALKSFKPPPNVKAVFAPNMCHDFGLWFRVVPHLPDTVTRLALVNDSCYVLKPLDVLFQSSPKADFWGITDSFEIAHHLQSYFTVYQRGAIQSLKDFVSKITMCPKTMLDKWHVVSAFEIGMSQFMIKSGHSPVAMYPINKLKLFKSKLHSLDRDNSSWYLWDRLLILGCPLLKKKRSTYEGEYEFIQEVTDIKG